MKIKLKTWKDCGEEAVVNVSILLQGPPGVRTRKSFISRITLLKGKQKGRLSSATSEVGTPSWSTFEFSPSQPPRHSVLIIHCRKG